MESVKSVLLFASPDLEHLFPCKWFFGLVGLGLGVVVVVRCVCATGEQQTWCPAATCGNRLAVCAVDPIAILPIGNTLARVLTNCLGGS